MKSFTVFLAYTGYIRIPDVEAENEADAINKAIALSEGPLPPPQGWDDEAVRRPEADFANFDDPYAALTCRDYGYCATCDMYFDLWKYDHSFKDAGHEGCNCRTIKPEELDDCRESCRQHRCLEDDPLQGGD